MFSVQCVCFVAFIYYSDDSARVVSRGVVAVIHNEHYSVAGGLDAQLSAADVRTADQINDVSMQ